MTPERWQEVKKVLAAVLEKTPEERTAYLDRADAEPDVRREVESLLLAEKRAKSSFLAQPTVTPQSELATGNRLGAYEIVARIGAGGMGEVYQARDTKLGRSVAIKVLPLAFVEDQDRLARFQREARVLASLNHPNIATIYGLEQSGSTPYLVMELIPGETLAERLKSGRLDIAKALGIAQQIAAALESAHEQGIVHRDLKPANIEVTPDGRVKVLDFGLAKALADGLDGNAEESAGKTAASEPGIILGTPAYMSPEQVGGKVADKRVDIWAFGCVLYEMLSGRRLFDGDSITEMLAEVLTKEPDWAGLPKTTPASIQRLIRRCLVKDPKQRLRDIGDARIAIEEERSGVEGPAMAGTVGHALEPDHGSSVRLLAATVARRHSRTLAIGVAAFVLSIVTLAYWFSPPLPPPSVSDYTQLSNDGHLKWLAGTDGSRIYIEEGFGEASRLNQMSVVGGETSRMVIPPSAMCALSFSSDASSMLMIDGPWPEGQFWALPTLGGSARQLAGARGHCGSWSPDGKKLAYANGNDLFVANADGTAPKKIFSSVDAVATVPFAAIPPGPRSIALPSIAWSPDGTKLRFTVAEPNQSGSIWQISSDGSNPAPLFPNWHPPGGECCGNWTADGKYFIFESQYQIWARRESGNLVQKVSHEPVELTDGSTTYVSPLPSKDGKQIFAVAGFARGELHRYDSKEKTFKPYLGGISAQDVAFSNDGQWVAYVSFPNGTLSRSRLDGSDKLQLSFPPLYPTFPQWSPDGKKVLFSAFERGKLWRIYLVAAEGGAPQELMPDDEKMQADPSWSPDGGSFVFSGLDDAAGTLRIFNMKTHRISMLAGSQGLYSPRWSPDGRYIAAMTAGEFTLMLYDFNAQKWSVLAKEPLAYPSWSRRGDYVYFLGGPTWTVKRVGVRTRKVEPVISLEGFPITGHWGFWLGLLPDDSPLVLKDTGTQDVVSLTFHEP